jgi:hypothetical protein
MLLHFRITFDGQIILNVSLFFSALVHANNNLSLDPALQNNAMLKSSTTNDNGTNNGKQGSVVGFRNRVKRTAGSGKRVPPSLDVAAVEAEHEALHKNGTPGTAQTRGPMTPPGVRGHADLRSPGVKLSPANGAGQHQGFAQSNDPEEDNAVIPDFITQTDRHGRATTPRSAEGVQTARQMHPSGPKPNLHVENGTLVEDHEEKEVGGGMDCQTEVDACDSLLDSLRMMCCCLLPEDEHAVTAGDAKDAQNLSSPVGYSTRGHDAPLLLAEDSALNNGNKPDRVKLLPELHRDDHGKKCLVLDLDETLVHSSFRAVPGADFVIPVQVCTFYLQINCSFRLITHIFPKLQYRHRLKMLFTLFMLPNVRVLTNFSQKWPSTTKLSSTRQVSISTPTHFSTSSIQTVSSAPVCSESHVSSTRGIM